MDAYDVLAGPVLRTQVVPSPAAGADWTFTIPGRSAMRILSVRAIFASAVAVATRFPALVITDGVSQVMNLPGASGEAASITETYCWAPTADSIQTGTGGSNSASIPDKLILPVGFTIGSSTPNIQAADQWSGIVIWTQEIPNYGMGAEVAARLYEMSVHLNDLADIYGAELAER